MFTAVFTISLLAVVVNGQNAQGSCKNPIVEKRLLADDVRYASPFYVIALPRTPKTEQIDNVCYTYFETGGGAFFHVMSVVYTNGSNTHHKFSKGDITDRMGLAQATAEKTSPCVYHDYTLVPICNVTVFVLYRCFIEGNCNNIDIGITPGVDVRVVLAATPKISDTCRLETMSNLKDTSVLDGGDYVILPQNRTPQCVTKYNNITSINEKNAVDPVTVSEPDVTDRFGDFDFLESTDAATVPAQVKDLQPMVSELADRNKFSDGSIVTEKAPEDQEATTALFSSVPDPSSLPKRTYAEVLKSSPNKKSETNKAIKRKPCIINLKKKSLSP